MASQAPYASPGGLNPDILWRVVGDEALLLDTISADYFSLDPIGTEILVGLTNGEAPEQIAAAMVNKYSVDAGRAKADIADLMSDLRSAGIWR